MHEGAYGCPRRPREERVVSRPDAVGTVDLGDLARQLRVDSIRCSTKAGSGHPTSSLSAADLMAVLLARFLRWGLDEPDEPNRDHLIFSKGHASPLLYAMLKATGEIDDAELLSYRRFGSRLQGHPVPGIPGVDVATGSLGQGLPIAVGIALAAQWLEQLPYRIWVLLGDSEMSEGSIWEAFDHARYYRLGHLVAILDMNRLGQRGETPLGWDSEAYAARARAFGWNAIEIDGHDLDAISAAYASAIHQTEAPSLIIARTRKGRGVSFLEDKEGWHGRALKPEQAEQAIAELGGIRPVQVQPPRPHRKSPMALPRPKRIELEGHPVGAKVATRTAYGQALAWLGSVRPDVVALDGEVGNSTCAATFAKAHPDRYFEMFIAEQQLVAAAVGLAVRGKAPFASTFAAFLTRAYDFIRMAAVSRANVRLCGSHAGVSIGEDGPSQMGLEDLAMLRAVEGSTVLYPCCANQTLELVAAMADLPGVSYLRTTREALPVLYSVPGPAQEPFVVGGSRVIRHAVNDAVTVVAAGITVHEALAAHDRLAERGIPIRVVDAYSIKPIDSATIRESALATGGNVVVVEDHWAEGGLGDAVRECLAGEQPIPARIVHLAVREMPRSGPGPDLLAAAHIDASAIVDAVLRIGARAEHERACWICGAEATWRILVAGEDELPDEEDACDLHAAGHKHLAWVRPRDRVLDPAHVH
jgi:transketolase